jgi:hypothetical protein
MGKLNPYYRINQVAGVQIRIDNDGQQIHLCAVEASGNQLTINKKAIDLTSIAKIKELLPDKSVISLNISGKGVLQKRTDKVETIDQNIFNKILPNARQEDFYVQNFISGEYSFVSVIRKTEADKLINQLKELSFQPLLLSLGLFPVENIIPQLNVYEPEIIIGGNQVKRNEKGEWLDLKPIEDTSPFAFKLGSERIDEELLVPYAAAFELVMFNQLDPIMADAEDVNKALQVKLDDQKLKTHGVIILMIIFTLLLVNFIVFSWLNSSNATLTEQVGKYTETNNNEQEISERIREKEVLLHTLGWDGSINKSVLIDQISSLLPSEITLREISVNPVDVAGSRIQKAVVFYDRKMVIQGNSEKIIPVNEWIARIKTKSWVKNIQLGNFTYNNELNTGQFTISINY